MKEYDHNKIEKKWQKEWSDKKVYVTLSSDTAKTKGKKPFYVLDMFPYPSGAGLHVGHPRGYIGSDVIARQKRMQGFNVLHPMGYDAFGLPAEQYAIANKVHPKKAVEINAKTFEKQLGLIGLSYDWARKIDTTDTEFYKWTQWMFLKIYDSWFDTEKKKARPIFELVKMFEKKGNTEVTAFTQYEGVFSAVEWKAMDTIVKQSILMHYRLAYEGYSEVNWCPHLGTVLANDEIVDSPQGPISERGGYAVEKKSMRQWFMRITAYGERLIQDLDGLDWPENIKEVQKNWIGKSEGSEIEFSLNVVGKKSEHSVVVFTTRADTLFGVTYVVLAPEHPLVSILKQYVTNKNDVEEYVSITKKKDEIARTNTEREKTGVCLKGITAINPANGEEVSVWIADYVLPQYGTGAVMAVPAHDNRDLLFANKFNLPSRQVVSDTNSIISSGNFDGMSPEFARIKITEFVNGKIVTKYKFRDAVFARQRYWGEPIPLYKDKMGVIHEVADKKLPLVLPAVKSYEPTGTGESPLVSVPAWKKGGFETNTMPGWAGSSWYFLRYLDPKNKKEFAGTKELQYWFNKKNHGGVDVYIGGAEHATGHLMYARFWHKVLFDYGLVPNCEPFQLLKNQGMILASDGRKMSKRWGNVVNPDDIVKTYGADTLRVYEMFMGPFEATLPWSTESIIGSRRFIERVYRFANKVLERKSKKTDMNAEMFLHRTIKKVTDDIANFSFNTAVSAMMICSNEMEKAENVSVDDFKKFIQILAPFAPHVTEDVWHTLGEKKSINVSLWPRYDEKKLVASTIQIAIQVNGKFRTTITVDKDATQESIETMAINDEKITQYLEGRNPQKIIYVPGRLVNFVI